MQHLKNSNLHTGACLKMKSFNATPTPAARHWMDAYGIKFEERLSITKAQLKVKLTPAHPLKTRVWAFLLLHTAGYQGELAQIMKRGHKTPVTSQDIAEGLQHAAVEYYRGAGIALTKQQIADLITDRANLRKALSEMEDDGMCERRVEDKPLKSIPIGEREAKLNGKVEIYVFLKPRKADTEVIRREFAESIAISMPENVQGVNFHPPDFSIQQITRLLKIENPALSKFLRLASSNPSYMAIVSQAWENSRENFKREVLEHIPADFETDEQEAKRETKAKKRTQGVTSHPPVGVEIHPPYKREEISEEIKDLPARPPDTTREPQKPMKQAGRLALQNFPEFVLRVRHHFPAASDKVLESIIDKAAAAFRQTGLEGELTDNALSKAVSESWYQAQKTPQAFEVSVPRCIQSWAEEILHERKSA